MRKGLLILTTTGLLASCGFMGDGDSRQGGLSPYDDVVTGPQCSPADMVCEYPPILTGGGHAVDLRDCAKLEGSQLGEDLVLDVNGETVTISNWQNKDGEGEWIAFEVDGDVVVVVKAGTELFEASEGAWVHPAGTGGPSAKGISFVAFCEPPSDDPVCRPADDAPESCREPGGGGGYGPSGGGDGSSGGGGDGDGSGGGDSDGDGYCDGDHCEPGGGYSGGSSGDGSGSGGDGDGFGGDGSGSGGDGSGGDDDGYCSAEDCEPGGGYAGGSSGDGSDGGGDGSSGSSGSGDGSGGDGGGTSGGSGGTSGSCPTTTCSGTNACPNSGEACVSGCCSAVIF